MITLIVCSVTVQATSPPHLGRDLNANIVLNASFADTTEWYLTTGATYDASQSKDADGTGSVKLSNAYHDGISGYDYFVSQPFNVEPGKLYTLSAFLKSDVYPAPIASLFFNFRRADNSWLENSVASLQGLTEPGYWQEVTTHVRVPAGASFAQVFALISRQHTGDADSIWFDNFFVGEGVSYERPPATNQAFSSSHIKIDQLGNVQVYRDGSWQAFIPLCIHADNNRPDWRIYSEQGFNCNMWAGSYQHIKKARDAISSFNPDGMMSGLDISGFMIPAHSQYNDLNLLSQRISDIFTNDLQESLLLYYWDNEKEQLSEWEVPISVTQRVRQADNIHPIYMLQSNEGVTRKYKTSSVNLIDATGDYVSVSTPRDLNGFDVLTYVERQTVPPVIAQLNYITGKSMRARIYGAIIKGAKGFSVWRDDYLGVYSNAGKVEDAIWWSELPILRAELDSLQPIIAKPHWTSWKANVSDEQIDVGTRDYNGEGYIIMANDNSVSVAVTISIDGLTYAPVSATDAITQEKLSLSESNTLNMLVPAYGSKVIKLDKF